MLPIWPGLGSQRRRAGPEGTIGEDRVLTCAVCPRHRGLSPRLSRRQPRHRDRNSVLRRGLTALPVRTRFPYCDLRMGPNVEFVLSELARARARLEDLEGEYSALADPENIALDDEHDSEGSTVGFERARVAGLLGRSRRQVADLEAAARRAVEGSYRYCTSCGREIGTERLSALPATQVCVGCAL
jgi:DnaK suppressor protein